MPQEITSYKIFIASPGGLDRERQAFRDAIASYNESEAIHRGAYFIPVGWELTLGGIGRPQDLINEEIRQCDYFVLLLWNRWGSPPDRIGRFSSGTEEEFSVAMECAHDPAFPMRQVVIYFKSPDPQQLSDPGEQLQRVLEFKKRLEAEKHHLYVTFDVPESFAEKLRRDLGRWLRDHEQGLPPIAASQQVPPAPLSALADPLPIPPTDQLVLEAEELEKQGKRTDAEAAFARAIVRGTEPQAFISYGNFLVRDARLAQATAMFERAIELSESLDSPEHMLQALNALGRVFQTLSDWRRAEEIHQKALSLAEKRQDLNSLADAYGNLGLVLEALNKLDEAEVMIRKSLEIEHQIDRPTGLAADYLNLGNVYRSRGDRSSAKEMYQKALAIALEASDHAGLSIAYANLALLARHRKDWAEAEELLHRALKFALEAKDIEGEATARLNLASVLIETNNLKESRKQGLLAMECALAVGAIEMIGITQWNLAVVDELEGDAVAALESYRKALEFFDRADLGPDAADARAKIRDLSAKESTPTRRRGPRRKPSSAPEPS